jgi:hypothetical protein
LNKTSQFFIGDEVPFNTVHQHMMTNNDHFQFNRQALYAVDMAGVEFLHVEEYRDAYEAAIEQEDSVINKIIKSELTDSIAEINDKRNNMIVSCMEITKSYKRHPDTVKQKAATNLEILWNANKNLVKSSLTAKTSGVYNMLQDLDGKYKPYAELLGLGEFIENLRDYNNSIEKLMDERYDESAAKVSIGVKDARLVTDGYLDKIISRVCAYINIEGIAKYQDFVNRLNVVIAKYSIGKVKKPSAEIPTENVPAPEETETPAEEKYPDAIEWVENFGVQNAQDGMIFYIIVEGEKVFYRLLDRAAVGFIPGGTKYQELWEKLS